MHTPGKVKFWQSRGQRFDPANLRDDAPIKYIQQQPCRNTGKATDTFMASPSPFEKRFRCRTRPIHRRIRASTAYSARSSG